MAHEPCTCLTKEGEKIEVRGIDDGEISVNREHDIEADSVEGEV